MHKDKKLGAEDLQKFSEEYHEKYKYASGNIPSFEEYVEKRIYGLHENRKFLKE